MQYKSAYYSLSTHATQTADDANKTSATAAASTVAGTALHIISVVQLREAIAILLLCVHFCFRAGLSCNILRLQRHIN